MGGQGAHGMDSIRTAVAGVATLVLLTVSGHAQQGGATHSGAPGAHASKHYFLPATPENVQWGWYDPGETPKLVIESGDTVSIETLPHALGQIKPGLEMDQIVKLRKQNGGGGPHSISGPIYVAGVEPGDTLEIRILKIVPKGDAFNFNLPGKDFPTVGLLAAEFPEGFVRYFMLDLARQQTEFKPGFCIDVRPFPGTKAKKNDPDEPAART